MKHTRKNPSGRKSHHPGARRDCFACSLGFQIPAKIFRQGGDPNISRWEDEWHDPDGHKPDWQRRAPWFFGERDSSDWEWNTWEADEDFYWDWGYYDPRGGDSFLRDPAYAA